MFNLFTGGKNLLPITLKYFNGEQTYQVNLKLLNEFQTDTESILFIDLIKSMVQEEPNYRGNCTKLIDHAFFKGNTDRLQIIRELAEKIFYNGKSNENLLKIMNKNEVHMEGSLGAEFAPWKKFLAETSKYSEQQPDIKVCSSLVKLISKQVIISVVCPVSDFVIFFLLF